MRMMPMVKTKGVSSVYEATGKTTARPLSPVLEGCVPPVSDLEVRPGGMLVQRRTQECDRSPLPVPTIRVRVKYGSTDHQIYISSQATFGELKKLLTAPTGLHHQDQKLVFKGKERSSTAFLDISGVKDRSKMVLTEDPISQEKRYLEMRRSAMMERASKSISEISLEVDRLAAQVSALESVISKGGKVAERDVLGLIELLMDQLLKLDGITADGDAKLQRKLQVRRVQKLVETLDMLKVKNSMSSGIGGLNSPSPNQPRYSNGQKPPPIQLQQPRGSVGNLSIQMQQLNLHHQQQKQQQQPPRHPGSGSIVLTTEWETFESAPAAAPALGKSKLDSVHPANLKFNWELFE